MTSSLCITILRNNFINKMPENHHVFYYLIKCEKYESALNCLIQIENVQERVLNRIPEEYYIDFARVLIFKTVNKYDLEDLLTAVLRKIISKSLWIERIKNIGYNSFKEFVCDHHFIYSLFTSKAILIFLNEYKDMIYELATIFAFELHSLIKDNDYEEQHTFITCIFFLFKYLNNEEREKFKIEFLDRIPILPKEFKDVKKVIKHLFMN